MSQLVGWTVLARFVLRRDRVRLVVWVATLGLVALFSARSIFGLYTDEAQLAQYAATASGNAAVVAMGGPVVGLETFGGRIAWELWPLGPAVALMALLTVTRHTRGEEEAGRTELVASGVVGRRAQPVAAVAVACGASLAVGVATAGCLVAQGLAVGGSVLLGAAFTATGAVFAATALLTAQLTGNARASSGLAGAALAASFLVRAIGDVTGGGLSWASPLGWMQATRPFAGDRWWPLLLPLAAVAALVVAALALADRRDLGQGVFAGRPGPADAPPRLRGVFGLAWRLQRGTLVAWVAGTFLAGVAMGAVAHSADDLVGDNEAIRDYLAQVGGASLTDLFLATILTYLGLAAAGCAAQSAARLRGEEATGRAEPVLATPTSRGRWAWSHLVLALAGSAAVVVLAGAGTGLAHGLAVGRAGEVPRLAVAALAFVPAVWCFAALAAAIVGLAPRAVVAVWAVFAACALLVMFGGVLDLPDALVDLSPFEHVRQVPAAAPSAAALAVPALVAAALFALADLGLRRRDLGS